MRISRYSIQGERIYLIYTTLGSPFSTADAARVLGKSNVGPIMSSLRMEGIVEHYGERGKLAIPQQRRIRGPTIWKFTPEIIQKIQWWIAKEENPEIPMRFREFKMGVKA